MKDKIQTEAEAEFLGEIQTKVLRVFLLAIHSHLLQLCLDFYFFKLTQPITISSVNLLYTVPEKVEEPDKKLTPCLIF